MRIAGIQMDCQGDPAVNMSRAQEWIRQAAAQGAQVICLPELYRSHYFCQSEDPALFDLAESIPGPSTDAFGQLARELGVVILVPIFERRAAGLYHNSIAVMGDDGQLVGIYRKMHIPDDPGFYEKFYFTPGDLGFKSFDTRFGKIGTLICWDQWYPEAARLTALQGAAVLFYPTAIGWQPAEKATEGAAQHDAWRTVQRSHAVANGVYVASINRIGYEPDPGGAAGIEFWGQSFIADPQGVILAEASVDQEEIIMADIDLNHLEDIRRMWPFLRDRRIDAFGGLTSRWLDSSAS
jgi:N-carbamoylputrescine amidase